VAHDQRRRRGGRGWVARGHGASPEQTRVRGRGRFSGPPPIVVVPLVAFRGAKGDQQNHYPAAFPTGRSVHTLIVSSEPPAARRRPSAEKATHSTSPVCGRVARRVHFAVSQSRTSPGRSQSPAPLASVLPSGAKATAHTSPGWPFSTASGLPRTRSQ